MPVSSPGAFVRSLPPLVAKSLWQRHVNRAWRALSGVNSSRENSSAAASTSQHIEYEQPLDGQKYDVAIVGAGIMGEWGRRAVVAFLCT